jgi:type VI protein secretion system component VasK
MNEFWTNPAFYIYLEVLTPFLAFVILYGAKSPWQASAAGRSVMILTGTLVLVILQGLATILFGDDWPWRGEARLTVLTLGSVAGWYLLYTLVTLQYRGRRLLDTAKQDSQPPEHRDHREPAWAERRRLRALRKTELDGR